MMTHYRAESVRAFATPELRPAAIPGPYAVRCVRTLDEINPGDWERVTAERSLFLQAPYLRCLERESHPGLQVRHALVTEGVGGRPIGAATFQVTDFVGPSIEPWLARGGRRLSTLLRALPLLRKELSLRVVVCGNAFCTGEHGVAFVPGVDPRRAALALEHAAAQVHRSLSGAPASATLFKEFRPSTAPGSVASAPAVTPAAELADRGYTEFQVQPTMLLTLDPRWRSFDDYLASLRSKFRVKARRAYAKSARLRRRSLTLEDIHRYEPTLCALHHAVLDRADYQLGALPIGALRQFRQALGEQFLLEGYFLDDQLVGMLTAFVNGRTLEAGNVGLDYRLNRKHGIYPRLLYDYLQLGLERGLSHVHYGRTATEIKSTVGAVPVPMSCYLRHRRSAINRALPLLARSVSLPEDPVRRPFREAPPDSPGPRWSPDLVLAS